MLGETAAAADTSLRTLARGDFVIRHWRARAPAAREPPLRRSHPADRPAALELGPHPSAANGVGGYDHSRRAEEGARYTSLRDLIESPPMLPATGGARSPGTPGAGGGGEIRIKNRLLKQAAYAYLQPTPSAAEYGRAHRRGRGGRAIRRAFAILTCGLALEPLDACIAFFRRLFRRPRL